MNTASQAETFTAQIIIEIVFNIYIWMRFNTNCWCICQISVSKIVAEDQL